MEAVGILMEGCCGHGEVEVGSTVDDEEGKGNGSGMERGETTLAEHIADGETVGRITVGRETVRGKTTERKR